MTSRRRIAGRVLLSVAMLFICLGMAELFLRIKNSSMTNYDIEMWRYAQLLKRRSNNPLLGHDHVKSASAVLQSVAVRTNEWGLRGGPVPPPVPGERRILFLGSSITFGWGVPEEETTTGVLQHMFEANGQKVTVLNGGIGNYNAPRSVERFFCELTGLQPTDIVVHSFVRDAEVLDTGGGNWFLRNSQLAVVLWSAIQKCRAGLGQQKLEEHYRQLYAADAPGFQAMQAALARLSDYAQAHHIRIYLAMVPDIHNLHDYKLHFIHDAVAAVAAHNGYRYVDLFPAFAGLRPEEVWAMPGDPHPNRLGHKKMAEMLYPVLATP
jgi:lysophospholipase L1-like esterase